MKPRSLIFILLVLIGLCIIGLAAEYNDWQQGVADGLRYGFKMGQAYQNALNGVNVTGFNAEVDLYNAWILKNFGDDQYLLMSKMGASESQTKLDNTVASESSSMKPDAGHSQSGSDIF